MIHVSSKGNTGAVTLDTSGSLRFGGQKFHQLQITARDNGGNIAVPAAGTVDVAIRASGADGFVTVKTSVAVNSAANWIQTYDALASEVRITVTGLTAGYTLDYNLSIA